MKNFKSAVLVILFLTSSFVPTTSPGADYTVLTAQKIKFQYYIGVLPLEGFFSLKDSFFAINFKNPEGSRLRLKFDLNSSSAGFFLATKAMLGPSVLYAEKHPYILFESKSVKLEKEYVFKIKGNVTIRGITKRITLSAKLENPEVLGSQNKSNLQFYISAKFKRSDFKATGYSNIVGDLIDLNSHVNLVTLE